MFSIVLILMLAGVLVGASVRLQSPNVDWRLPILLLISFAIRLGVSSLTRDINLFTSAAVDSHGYEALGETIARLWRHTGIHYVGGDELPDLRDTSLPSNIFACVDYLNGEATHLGCVAIVAAAACFVCLNMYLVSLQLGARPDIALLTTALISVMPNFLFYTCDTFKDGFVALFVLGILGCSIRLSRKFSFTQVALAAAFLSGLWVTRFYLVFITPACLLLGFLGVRSRSILRMVLASLLVVASVVAVYSYSSAPQEVVGLATQTFEGATSQDILNSNAEGGSGVTFENSSPLASFLPKLAYTLFSPFPWQSGSVGLQIGKMETLLWYYFVYRAVRSAKLLWRAGRSDLMVFASLIVPMTVAYAFSFSNIGLIARQRVEIVLATMVLATVSWRPQEASSVARVPSSRAPTPA